MLKGWLMNVGDVNCCGSIWLICCMWMMAEWLAWIWKPAKSKFWFVPIISCWGSFFCGFLIELLNFQRSDKQVKPLGLTTLRWSAREGNANSKLCELPLLSPCWTGRFLLFHQRVSENDWLVYKVAYGSTSNSNAALTGPSENTIYHGNVSGHQCYELAWLQLKPAYLATP